MLFPELLPYEQASVWIFIHFLSADILSQRDLCLVPVESSTLPQPLQSYLAEFVFCVSISRSFRPLLPLELGSLLPTQESRSRPDLPIKPAFKPSPVLGAAQGEPHRATRALLNQGLDSRKCNLLLLLLTSNASSIILNCCG